MSESSTQANARNHVSQERLLHLQRFYSILDRLEHRIRGARRLDACDGKMGWPQRGVYFFREAGEERTDSGRGPRVVRVGTHALTDTSRTTLWKRLAQHKGLAKGAGGNHRGSIFRLLVGSTLVKRPEFACATWAVENNAPREIRQQEQSVEREVSAIIGAMPFLWVAIDDPPSRASLRGRIERNSIALLSNLGKPPLDAPSASWLGHLCDRGKGRVKGSGLWNQNHVDEQYDPAFLDVLDSLVDQTGPLR